MNTGSNLSQVHLLYVHAHAALSTPSLLSRLATVRSRIALQSSSCATSVRCNESLSEFIWFIFLYFYFVQSPGTCPLKSNWIMLELCLLNISLDFHTDLISARTPSPKTNNNKHYFIFHCWTLNSCRRAQLEDGTHTFRLQYSSSTLVLLASTFLIICYH